MKIATLGIIENERGEVLLGYKRGNPEIGDGTWNGPGGKLEPRDVSLLACLARECEEELGILIDQASAELVAIVTFYAAGIPDFEGHIYRVRRFTNEPRETESMATPRWFLRNALPYGEMLESDRHWFPLVLGGERIRAKIFYRERAKGFERMETEPLQEAA